MKALALIALAATLSLGSAVSADAQARNRGANLLSLGKHTRAQPAPYALTGAADRATALRANKPSAQRYARIRGGRNAF